LNNWLRTVLFVSAFAPVLIVVGGIRLGEKGFTMEVFQLFVVGTLGTFLPVLIIRLLARSGENFPIKIKKVEPNDFMFVMFLVSYTFPFFNKVDQLTFNQIAVMAAVIFFVALYTNYVPAHPVLRIFRFRFYKVEAESGMVYTLLAKRDILGPGDLKSVTRISATMLMEVKVC
jgi:hypothetical protein